MQVPPFSHTPKPIHKRYHWWSWHPKYPYWSKSCWGGDTVEDALREFDDNDFQLEDYHNKLILETETGYVEVVGYDKPPTKPWPEENP